MIYTVLIAVGRVGAIWARRKAMRKAFQTLVVFAVMMTIIKINQEKNNKELGQGKN